MGQHFQGVQRVKKVVWISVAILSLWSIHLVSLYAASPDQQEQGTCLIRSPAPGSVLRGQVAVVGSAMHPEFTWYQVGYAPDPNPTGEWKFFTNGETAVQNGQLGIWDTNTIPDGIYQLILEVHRSDGNNDHCTMGQLRINNTAPTPTFTPIPLPTAADTPTPLPFPTDTPTAAIEQPPTATPRATPTYSPANNPTPTPQMTRFQLPIEVGSVRDWSCRGAQMAIGIAAVVTLYFVIRNAVISGVRKVSDSKDMEGFHRRRPRHY
jgi:hypothetical protein